MAKVTAEISDVRGLVTLESDGQEKILENRDMISEHGALLTTDALSSVLLKFSDGREVEVGPNSEVTLDESFFENAPFDNDETTFSPYGVEELSSGISTTIDNDNIDTSDTSSIDSTINTQDVSSEQLGSGVSETTTTTETETTNASGADIETESVTSVETEVPTSFASTSVPFTVIENEATSDTTAATETASTETVAEEEVVANEDDNKGHGNDSDNEDMDNPADDVEDGSRSNQGHAFAYGKDREDQNDDDQEAAVIDEDHDRGHGNNEDGADSNNPAQVANEEIVVEEVAVANEDDNKGHGNDSDSLDDDNPTVNEEATVETVGLMEEDSLELNFDLVADQESLSEMDDTKDMESDTSLSDIFAGAEEDEHPLSEYLNSEKSDGKDKQSGKKDDEKDNDDDKGKGNNDDNDDDILDLADFDNGSDFNAMDDLDNDMHIDPS